MNKQILILVGVLGVGSFFYFKNKQPPVEVQSLPELKLAQSSDKNNFNKIVNHSDQSRFSFNITQGDSSRGGGVFFIAGATVPDGSKFQVALLGAPSNISDPKGYFQSVTVEIKNRLATTDRFVRKGNAPLPKGKYYLYMTEAKGEQQPSQFAKQLSAMKSADSTKLPKFLDWGPKIVIMKVLDL